MSEQRFTIQKASGMYLHLPIFDNGVEMADGDVCILLNEQQATIRRLQDLCGESDGENAKLRLKNKKLQDKIDWLCEKYDYPNEKDKTKVVKMTNRTDEKELRKLLGLIDDE